MLMRIRIGRMAEALKAMQLGLFGGETHVPEGKGKRSTVGDPTHGGKLTATKRTTSTGVTRTYYTAPEAPPPGQPALAAAAQPEAAGQQAAAPMTPAPRSMLDMMRGNAGKTADSPSAPHGKAQAEHQEASQRHNAAAAAAYDAGNDTAGDMHMEAVRAHDAANTAHGRAGLRAGNGGDLYAMAKDTAGNMSRQAKQASAAAGKMAAAPPAAPAEAEASPSAQGVSPEHEALAQQHERLADQHAAEARKFNASDPLGVKHNEAGSAHAKAARWLRRPETSPRLGKSLSDEAHARSRDVDVVGQRMAEREKLRADNGQSGQPPGTLSETAKKASEAADQHAAPSGADEKAALTERLKGHKAAFDQHERQATGHRDAMMAWGGPDTPEGKLHMQAQRAHRGAATWHSEAMNKSATQGAIDKAGEASQKAQAASAAVPPEPQVWHDRQKAHHQDEAARLAATNPNAAAAHLAARNAHENAAATHRNRARGLDTQAKATQTAREATDKAERVTRDGGGARPPEPSMDWKAGPQNAAPGTPAGPQTPAPLTAEQMRKNDPRPPAEQNGYDAGHRFGTARASFSGQGAAQPKNPHAANSPEAGHWDRGFQKGHTDAGGAARAETERPAAKPAQKTWKSPEGTEHADFGHDKPGAYAAASAAQQHAARTRGTASFTSEHEDGQKARHLVDGKTGSTSSQVIHDPAIKIQPMKNERPTAPAANAPPTEKRAAHKAAAAYHEEAVRRSVVAGDSAGIRAHQLAETAHRKIAGNSAQFDETPEKAWAATAAAPPPKTEGGHAPEPAATPATPVTPVAPEPVAKPRDGGQFKPIGAGKPASFKNTEVSRLGASQYGSKPERETVKGRQVGDYAVVKNERGTPYSVVHAPSGASVAGFHGRDNADGLARKMAEKHPGALAGWKAEEPFPQEHQATRDAIGKTVQEHRESIDAANKAKVAHIPPEEMHRQLASFNSSRGSHGVTKKELGTLKDAGLARSSPSGGHFLTRAFDSDGAGHHGEAVRDELGKNAKTYDLQRQAKSAVRPKLHSEMLDNLKGLKEHSNGGGYSDQRRRDAANSLHTVGSWHDNQAEVHEQLGNDARAKAHREAAKAMHALKDKIHDPRGRSQPWLGESVTDDAAHAQELSDKATEGSA